MTKLDELKDYMEQVKNACQSGRTNPHMGVKWQEMEVLIQIAEAAFEITEPKYWDDGYWNEGKRCDFCKGTEYPTNGYWGHADECPYERIRKDKRELESGD